MRQIVFARLLFAVYTQLEEVTIESKLEKCSVKVMRYIKVLNSKGHNVPLSASVQGPGR